MPVAAESGYALLVGFLQHSNDVRMLGHGRDVRQAHGLAEVLGEGQQQVGPKALPGQENNQMAGQRPP